MFNILRNRNKLGQPKGKKALRNEDGTIDNLPNALNPAFYRGMHLEMARRLTSTTQGGYIELDEDNASLHAIENDAAAE